MLNTYTYTTALAIKSQTHICLFLCVAIAALKMPNCSVIFTNSTVKFDITEGN